MMRESDLHRHLINRFAEGSGIWHTNIQPALGATMGAADMMVMNRHTKAIHPVELKVGRLVGWDPKQRRHTRLRPSRIRPAQIAWLDRLQRAGNGSRLVIGVMDDVRDFNADWDVWYTDDCSQAALKDWPAGFPLDRLVQVTTHGTFAMAAWERGLFGPQTPVALGLPAQPFPEPAGAKFQVPS